MNLNKPVSTTQIGWGLAHRFHNDDAAIPFYINDATITEWNGKHIPVMVDATANHTVTTAVDGAAIVGYLVMAEDRKIEGIKIGTVQMHGATNLPIKDADALAPGDLVVGGGEGTIRKALEADGVAGVGRICTAVYTAEDGKTYADVVFS
jgi:phage baseplate assembly protein gpV